MRRNRTTRRQRFVLEALEERAVPATFGVPWQDPTHLTLSFAPDGTPIAGHTSSLFQLLNAKGATSDWQRQILGAFQTWAVQANINIGLVADGGQPFGTTGPAQHDPRFGDIRIGAQPMAPDALSISVPNDPLLSTTWTGDMLLNANESFGSGGLDLFSVALHEAGHVLGLGDSTDPNSPLYESYKDNNQLTSSDITALQTLYGVRVPDSHEGSSGNDTMNSATQVPFPGSYTGTTPLVEYGDITTTKDVDFYAVKPPSNYNGPITFRLQSQGISLLTPHLTVVDAKGNVLGEAEANSDFGDTVTVHLNQSSANATYYVKVEDATHDVFGVGSYGLAITFDATNQVSPTTLDSVLRGPYQNLNPNDLAVLLQSPSQVVFNSDQQTNDTANTATQLTTAPGFAQNTRYQMLASISSPTDVDFYRVQPPNAPSAQTLVLTTTIRAVDPNGAAPRVTVFDGNMNPVNHQIIANGGGVFTIQAANLKQGGNYYLRVAADGAGNGVGNYALDARFGTTVITPTSFAQGNLDANTVQQAYHFYVGESQLFQFLLGADSGSAPAGSAVKVSVLDQNNTVVYSQTTSAGDTTSGPALFLTPGAYTLVFTAIPAPDGTIPALTYSLSGEAISDPIGPVVDDPTYTPVYQASDMPGVFIYPTTTTTTMDTYWITLYVTQPLMPTS